MQRREEFDVLDKLRNTGPLPCELEQRHQKLRRQQFFKAGLKADHYPPPSTSRLVDADMTVADWLQERWSSADETVRHSLRLLADALGIPLPMTRTRPIPMSRTRDCRVSGRDSSPARRTGSGLQPSQAEARRKESPTDRPAGPDYHDPPEWDDDDAPEWEPVESLRDAFRSEDRGWS